MPVPRRFDHDECRALYATGEWTQAALGLKYGVCQARVNQIVNPAVRARNDAASAAWRRAHYWQDCSSCGTRIWRRGNKETTGLCTRCLGVSRRTAAHGTETRYNRGCHCDECRAAATAARRARRAANPEAETAYQRTYRQRKRAAA